MIDHVTIHVPLGTLDDVNLTDFFWMLGFEEAPANDPFEHGYKVRWFARPSTLYVRRGGATVHAKPYIHLVEAETPEHAYNQDVPALGHFCVTLSDGPGFDIVGLTARDRGWLERDSGSGRIWVRFNNVRIEVRP